MYSDIDLHFLTWSDPEGRFSTKYPASWKSQSQSQGHSQARKGKREGKDEGKETGTEMEMGSNVIFAAPFALDGYVTIDLKKFAGSGSNIHMPLSYAFRLLLQGIESDADHFRIIQDNTENSKYIIDGEDKTASAIFSANIPIQGNNYRNVYCLVVCRLLDYNSLFIFTFTADPKKFDNVLPKAEYMIDTIKIFQ